MLATVLLLLLPATIAVLGFGEPFYQAVNPLMLFRLIRGLGPYYLLILAFDTAIHRHPVPAGAARRVDGGVVRGHPDLRDLVLQSHRRLHVSAPAPARLRTEPESRAHGRARRNRTHQVARAHGRRSVSAGARRQTRRGDAAAGELAEASRRSDRGADAQYVASQALGWDSAGLNTIGSTLIRHLLRAGRPDAALAVFERLRQRLPDLHAGFGRRPAHAGRLRRKRGPHGARGLDAPGNADSPPARLGHDNCQGPLLTGATGSAGAPRRHAVPMEDTNVTATPRPV